MKEWFLSLAPRERLLVAGGAGVLAVVLVYLLAIEPAIHAVAQRERRVQTLESQLEWMRSAAAEAEALRAAGASDATGSSDQAPYLAVDTVLRGSSLPQPDRLEPTDDEGARVEFEQVPFDPLVHIIGRLRSEHGLRVARARITRSDGDGDGVVAARLTLERAQ